MHFNVTLWKGTRVLVTSNNDYKGYKGMITDVLCATETLWFELELNSNPIRVVILDYENLLEELYVYYLLCDYKWWCTIPAHVMRASHTHHSCDTIHRLETCKPWATTQFDK